MNGRRLLKLFPALALAACSGEITQPPMEDARGTAYGFAPGAPTIEEFEVCKTYRGAVGPAVTVDWSVERQSGQPGASGSVVLNDGQCTTVYTYSNDAYSDGGLEVQTVTVTERPVPGYTTSYVLSSKASQTVDPVVGPETAGNSASGAMTSNPDNGFVVEFINTEIPIPSADGRMTGGGSVFTDAGMRVTHGFELHCDLTEPNRLQVNWNRNRFHLTELSSAVCTDDPSYDEGQPRAGFDTFEGVGTGRYNGVDGYGIQFRFVDDGQPGTGDIAFIEVTDGSTVVMTVENFLVRGNHQAHRAR